ncbi:TlpA family protein disulfide reductase [Chryseobacterium jejuense]|uniref:TlpA family protein disulfide reductase n=1 Tax=Chryseobacterium jejuense TaxID=445960 RepID=UPI001AE24080|nr:TlpA disulfide reductase family protein [Chryseobacterium jejuense]MBP2618731.1 peroxiredoxin [Chryseobacterium jejuense]
MKNRKFLKISIITIPIVLIGVMIYLFLSFQQKKEKINALKNIPVFSLQTIDNTLLKSQDLVNDQTKVIIYFSPTCHYCQAEAEELSKTHNQYRNIQWIWVASEPLKEIKQFAHEYGLDKQSNIRLCHDAMAQFYQKLGMNSLPYFLVYDENNHLIKRYSGATKLEKLLLESTNERK